jgi:hypothetical protein
MSFVVLYSRQILVVGLVLIPIYKFSLTCVYILYQLLSDLCSRLSALHQQFQNNLKHDGSLIFQLRVVQILLLQRTTTKPKPKAVVMSLTMILTNHARYDFTECHSNDALYPIGQEFDMEQVVGGGAILVIVVVAVIVVVHQDGNTCKNDRGRGNKGMMQLQQPRR